MIRMLESFGPYATADLPASQRWDSAQQVTIVAGGGRSGQTDDNCAALDAALLSTASRTLPFVDVAGLYTVTYGLAVRILTITDTLILTAIETSSGFLELVVTSLGVVRLTQTDGVPLGTVCESVANTVPVVTGGAYIEVQVIYQDGLATACQIRVSGQSGQMNVVATGALLQLPVSPVPTTFRLGTGLPQSAGTFRVTDIYVTDGVPELTPQSTPTGMLYNDGFLGNTHVQSFYPTADGANQSVGNTPWVPNSGAAVYDRINEHPPDGDVTYAEADTTDQRSTMVYQSPQSNFFAKFGCSAYGPIYGLQWCGMLRAPGTPGTVAPVIRRIVTGEFVGDVVAEGDPILVDQSTYTYYPQMFGRNPTLSSSPWTFAIFHPGGVGVPGSTEFGIVLQ